MKFYSSVVLIPLLHVSCNFMDLTFILIDVSMIHLPWTDYAFTTKLKINHKTRNSLCPRFKLVGVDVHHLANGCCNDCLF